ncbi:hypothetical protein [Asticcacaulis sp. MM231]|uniref:hypothetical protein n=1 Tax=Asticcacaulis sp. MM231 TaxID=3157666 RepID=UPI0032D595FF
MITIGQTWHLATNLLLALVAGNDATLPQLPGLKLSVTQFRHLRLALYTGYLSLPSGKSTGVTVQAHLKPRLTLIEDRRPLESEYNMEENSKDLRPHLNEIVSLCQNRAVDQVVAALLPRFESFIRPKPVKLFDSLETLYSSQHSG